jgi:hypothetical protein
MVLFGRFLPLVRRRNLRSGRIFLRRFNSRTAAIVLFILASVAMAVTVANKAGANLGGGTNIILALIVLWAAIRAVEATFKLHGKFAASSQSSSDAI